MNVFGADFSGVMKPSKAIYYAEALLDNNNLIIERVVHCDDRLDLSVAIHSAKAPWGIDFPFSFPVEALEKMKIGNWSELLAKVVEYKRSEFDRLISDYGIISCEAWCREPYVCCRAVDASMLAAYTVYYHYKFSPGEVHLRHDFMFYGR